MVFINDSQAAQTQQTTLELIRVTEKRLDEFIDFLAELIELLLSLERQEQQQSVPVDLGEAMPEYPALPGRTSRGLQLESAVVDGVIMEAEPTANYTALPVGTQLRALEGKATAASLPGAPKALLLPSGASDPALNRGHSLHGISAAPDFAASSSFSYQSDCYTLEGTTNSQGTRQYQVSNLEGRCCLSAIAQPGGTLQIEHLDSHLSPDDLARWDAQLSAMKTRNARFQKDLAWVKECYEDAPDWCPRGTSAILVADQVMNHTQTSTFYSDKVGMTFTRTEAGIDLMRQDRTVACRLDAAGIQSHLTSQETAYFRDAYNQFVQAQAHQHAQASVQRSVAQRSVVQSFDWTRE